MPLVRVLYTVEKYDFDYVASELLDTLIAQDKITHFYRPSERRWVNIRLDPIRSSVGEYHGPERRRKGNGPKPIGEKGRLNAEARCSGWLDGLWRLVEGHYALG